MTATPAPSFSADPLGSFDLDTLLSGAARLRGDRLAVADDLRALTFGELDAQSDAVAAAWTDMGLAPGETILVCAGARASAVLALVAGLRAGLRVALAPLHLDGQSLGAFARACAAVALVGDGAYGELSPAEDCLAAAASAPNVRLVCTLDGTDADGAVTLDPTMLAGADRRATRSRRGPPVPIVTFDANGVPMEHQQRTLVASGLDLVARARIGMRLPILSTFAPASFAGIVAGPLGSFLAGAPLRLVGPFEPHAFLRSLGDSGPCHCIVPAGLLHMCETAGIVSAERMASLLLVSRTCSAAARRDPPALTPARGLPSIIDLHAIGEHAALSEPRGLHGDAADLLKEPHYISIDERRILAAGWSDGSDRQSIEGAAISLRPALP